MPRISHASTRSRRNRTTCSGRSATVEPNTGDQVSARVESRELTVRAPACRARALAGGGRVQYRHVRIATFGLVALSFGPGSRPAAQQPRSAVAEKSNIEL